MPFFSFFSKGNPKKVLEKRPQKLRIPRRRAQKGAASVFGLAGYFFKNGQREWSYKDHFSTCFWHDFGVFLVFSVLTCFLCFQRVFYVCFMHVLRVLYVCFYAVSCCLYAVIVMFIAL